MKIDRKSFYLFPDQVAAWSFRRKLRNPFAGLRFFRRTSDLRTINLVSRHWPHLLCWSWCLSWNRRPSQASGFVMRWRPRFHRHNGGGWAGCGPLHLSWQNYQDMVGCAYEAEVAQFIEQRAA